MKIKVLLQARSFSKRLPFKSLHSIYGLPAVLLCVKRLSNTGAEVIVLTSNETQDDELVKLLVSFNIKVFRGSLKNVYERFIKATKNMKNDDIIVRATADNIFNDGYLIDQMYKKFKKEKLNYLSLSRNHNAPKGIGVELIKLNILRSLSKRKLSPSDKEHVTLSIRKKAEFKKFIEFKDFKFKKIVSKIRVTIDTIEDFIKIKKFVEDQENFIGIKSKDLIRKFIKQDKNLQKDLKKQIKKKRLLILGASHDQVGTIKIAKNMGLHTIAFDKNFNAAGKNLVDQFILLSNRNLESLKFFVKSIEINGVISQGLDLPHISSSLEKQIGIKNIPIKTSYICTDKYKMKRFFKRNLIPVPKFFLQPKDKRLRKIEKYPIVIKPLDKSGAKGVLLCRNIKDFQKLNKKTFAETEKKNILIEEYLEGPQISTESLIYNSQIFTAGYVDRNYEMLNTTKPAIIENGGTYPSNYIKFYNLINNYISILAKKLKIKNGVIKGDIVINKNKVFFIEIAVRLSGGDFSESVIPFSSSFNLIKNSIKLAINKKLKKEELKINFKKIYYANRYFFAKKGRLTKIDGIEKVEKKSWIKKILIFNKLGDKLEKTSNHSNRLGVFVLSAPSIGVLNKRIKYVYSKIKFKIKSY